jgi:glycosyltransferase involved in cell wall biosynthesis
MNLEVRSPLIAVVIPCYAVSRQVVGVLQRIGPEVQRIYVVDDACPEESGRMVRESVLDPRVRVLTHPRNLGVGAAVVTGYRQAVADGADVVVKIDGDGQMDPRMLLRLVNPIVAGVADYAKGNRFFGVESMRPMPTLRKLGNLALSLFSKGSSGYWQVFDPTNGYTAIHAAVLRALPLDKLEPRYFFESDLLFRLNLLGAVVCDIPMTANYGTERSGLQIGRAIPEFLFKHLRNMTKRLVYVYFLNDFSIASIELLLGTACLLFGTLFGSWEWLRSFRAGVPASAGTVMLAALPVLLGVQLLLAFLAFDVGRKETVAFHRRISYLPVDRFDREGDVRA